MLEEGNKRRNNWNKEEIKEGKKGNIGIDTLEYRIKHQTLSGKRRNDDREEEEEYEEDIYLKKDILVSTLFIRKLFEEHWRACTKPNNDCFPIIFLTDSLNRIKLNL